MTLTTLLTKPRPPLCASLTTEPVRPITLIAASVSVFPTSRPSTYPAEKLIADRIMTAPAEMARVRRDASVDERVDVSFDKPLGDEDLLDKEHLLDASGTARDRFLELPREPEGLLVLERSLLRETRSRGKVIVAPLACPSPDLGSTAGGLSDIT